MRKFKACLDTAIRFVKQKRNSAISSARDVKLVLLNNARVEEDGEPDFEDSGPLVVRSISGAVVYSQEAAGDGMHVAEIVTGVCESTDARADEVHILAGDVMLDHAMILGKGQCVSHPGPGRTLELAVAIVAGPPVQVLSSTGSRIEILDGVPEKGDRCHFDRDYIFTDLGDFDGEGMHYIMTSNDDRKTSNKEVMWQLDIREPVTIFINFRSENHVHQGQARGWLDKYGWKQRHDWKSTVSSGFPNGPYRGPVYARTIHPKKRRYVVDLMGSNFWEGTYFVFVQVKSALSDVVEVKSFAVDAD